MKNKLFWTIIIFTSAIVACLLIVINYKDNDYTRETTLNSIYSVKPTNIKLNINYEYKENNNQTQAKVYTSVKDLKSELSIKLLNTSYFKNYESLLIKNKDYCEIYIIPNGTTKNYSTNLDIQNSTNFLNTITKPYIKASILTNKNQTSISHENLMDYKLLTPIKLANSNSIQVIKDYPDGSPNKKYRLLFSHNNIVYNIYNISDLEDTKTITNSLFKTL